VRSEGWHERHDVNGIEMHVWQAGQPTDPKILLLHGFTNSSESWAGIVPSLAQNYHLIMPDLIGHGMTDSPEDSNRYTMPQVVADLTVLLIKLEIPKCVCVGYSMGGRVALSLSLMHPEKITALVLESASPGLDSVAERTARAVADDLLANRIEYLGIRDFISEWEQIPLFTSQMNMSEDKKQRMRDIRTNQSTRGLANSLRGYGTGKQPSWWAMLDTLQIPVLLCTGSHDHKFTGIAARMIHEIRNCEHWIVEGCGHTVHAEKPDEYIKIIDSFIF